MSNSFLILGCYGRTDDDFISCHSIRNKILEVHSELEGIKDMKDYFGWLRLYQKPLNDYNAVRRVLFNMQDKYYQNLNKIWSDRKFRLIENFTISHKMCGIYLELTHD